MLLSVWISIEVGVEGLRSVAIAASLVDGVDDTQVDGVSGFLHSKETRQALPARVSDKVFNDSE